MTQNKYFSYNDGVSYTHLFKKENAFIAPNKGMRIRSFFIRELYCIRRLNKISAANLQCIDANLIDTYDIVPIREYQNIYNI